MSVDKAFELWDKSGRTSEEKIFSSKYRNQGKDLGIIEAYYSGYKAGQKTLSPEVMEVLSEIAGCDPDTWCDCWLYFNTKAKNLLEAGE